MKNGHNPTCPFEYVASKDVIVSLEHDADVIRSITELARSRGVEAGSFTAIGALKCARLGYFDQKRREYREMKVDMPHEMASCVGNISLKDGEPFVHAHVVLADEAGNTKAGHLFEGIVFAAEVHLHQLEGPKLERRHDEVSGLSLWITEQRTSGER
jgi:hypothetical protein